MLTYTYVHAHGIGPATEKRIWASGITDWQSFLENTSALDLPEHQISMLVPLIEESIEHYDSSDFGYFARKLHSRDHWRAFGDLEDRTAFLDIETTGSFTGAAITVIGVYDGDTTKSFVKGYNLEQFADEIEKYSLLVTYAGASFDLPHLRHAFPGTKLDQLHIDLCPTLRRIGYKGGLKHIEEEMGIVRPDGVKGLDGWDAVRLWNEWEYGSRESLDLLIEYNRQDVVNLRQLAKFAYKQLRESHLPLAAAIGSEL